LRRTLALLPDPALLAARVQAAGVRVTILAGENDEPSLEPSKALARALEGAELVVIPGAGHVLNLTAPAVFNAKLGALLGADPSGAP
jgi:pimeloyl-ACP methyl ester carboxylesterase